MKIEYLEKDGIQYAIIPTTEYTELIKDRKVLSALYAAGVDNWVWYGDALDGIITDEESEEDIYGT